MVWGPPSWRSAWARSRSASSRSTRPGSPSASSRSSLSWAGAGCAAYRTPSSGAVSCAVERFAPGRDPFRLALVQYTVCSLLSVPTAPLLEPGKWPGLLLTVPTVPYTGFLSIGLGYTERIVAQRHTSPTHAAIILSLESVFAALSGWLALGEALSPRQLTGCGLMLAGMLLAQVPRARTDRA